MDAWVKSAASDYVGQPISLVAEALPAPLDADMGLLFESEMKRYGISSAFAAPIEPKDQPLVVQYEVTLTGGLTCGGAYIKVLESAAGGAAFDGASLDGSTPYVIMFGPDKCGDTNKVHFIFRHKNPVSGAWEEKHLKSPPKPKTDGKPHTYTLVVRPSNAFEILIDGASEASGSLLEDFEPAVNPPKEIDDPDDKKPEDWVDLAKIDDPEASKPDDWDEDAPKEIPDAAAEKPAGWLDDEPDNVADPEAVRPADWDDEEDGEWEAPLVSNPKCESAPGCGEWQRPNIPNPEYKGKWKAPKIDNPEYKGVWAPRKIDNPNYFVDEQPSALAAMGALAVEIWTTNKGIKMDNFAIGHDEASMKAFYEATLPPKLKAYEAQDAEKAKAQKKADLDEKRAEGGLMNQAEVLLSDAIEKAKENPMPAAATALALTLSFLFLCCRGGGDKPREEPAAEAPAPATEGDAAAEDEDEEEEEEEEVEETE